jgi:tetratricopeptide (TPR) repeat protein
MDLMLLHEPPDSHHYQAAMGWLELGNHLEANEELEQISPLNRAHIDVLEMRWKIYEKAMRWEVCAELAEAMKLKAPADPRGLIYLAQTHSGQKLYQAAYDVLVPVVKRFPDSWWIRYDLACYACLLGRLVEARNLLEEVFSLDQTNEAKLKSLNDPDLKALWAVIGSLPEKQAGTSEAN